MVPARALICSGIFAAMLIASCSRAPAPAHVEAVPAAFQQQQQAWRDERVRELTQADGWTTLVGMHWLDAGAHYAGSASDNGIRLAVGPPQFGMFDVRGGRVRFVPHAASALRIDGRPARASLLRADDDAAGPSVITFDDGKGVATVIRRGGRFALRVKHADASTRTGFRGLQYWPGGPDWVVDARFLPHPRGTMLEVANLIGVIEPTPNPGRVEFERDGRTYRLEALEGEAGGLFLVFADRTSGHGSYGAGRFLDTAAPAGDRVVVDFNRSYNPPCAFTSFATCPLPPAANRMDLVVAAGERAYAAH